ncbi:hypothetical protein [Natrinema halophilum]|uniref:Uncharacterized protein n=1 Tax=Natrinema halophilum TaxID=1699371 RepID=A0A7D5KKF9_9EURY|nr:hypothetical protein [Natrinema halophilum]QLG50379.1 hypothetical protein HYG82_16765 [Natrinema halophilum]
MTIRTPFGWALVYRTIAVGSLVLGLALVAAGLFAGFGGAATTLITEPLNPDLALEQANPMITVLFAAFGIVVWQVGKTYALFMTLPRAAGQAAGGQIDSNRVASEVREGIDDRLAQLEAELEETRRAVEALEAGDRRTTGEQPASFGDDESATWKTSSSGSSPLPPSSPHHATRDGTEVGDDETSSDTGDGGETDGDAVGDRDESDDASDPLA